MPARRPVELRSRYACFQRPLKRVGLLLIWAGASLRPGPGFRTFGRAAAPRRGAISCRAPVFAVAAKSSSEWRCGLIAFGTADPFPIFAISGSSGRHHELQKRQLTTAYRSRCRRADLLGTHPSIERARSRVRLDPQTLEPEVPGASTHIFPEGCSNSLSDLSRLNKETTDLALWWLPFQADEADWGAAFGRDDDTSCLDLLWANCQLAALRRSARVTGLKRTIEPAVRPTGHFRDGATRGAISVPNEWTDKVRGIPRKSHGFQILSARRFPAQRGCRRIIPARCQNQTDLISPPSLVVWKVS